MEKETLLPYKCKPTQDSKLMHSTKHITKFFKHLHEDSSAQSHLFYTNMEHSAETKDRHRSNLSLRTMSIQNKAKYFPKSIQQFENRALKISIPRSKEETYQVINNPIN